MKRSLGAGQSEHHLLPPLMRQGPMMKLQPLPHWRYSRDPGAYRRAPQNFVTPPISHRGDRLRCADLIFTTRPGDQQEDHAPPITPTPMKMRSYWSHHHLCDVKVASLSIHGQRRYRVQHEAPSLALKNASPWRRGAVKEIPLAMIRPKR